jgi:hypothetical protein
VASREVSGYRATLLDTQERQLFEARVAAPEPGIPVTLLVPARELDPGDYTLVFREDDQAAREAGRFVFTLERR